MNCTAKRRHIMKLALGTLAIGLALAASMASAQPEPASGATSMKTFYLANSIQGNDTNEILVAMRNMLDIHAKIYLVQSQNAIVVQGTSDQLILAQQLLNDLDRPRKTYRLTYTLTEIDDGKRVGTQHFAMIVVSGQRTTLKQGNKIPVLTGSFSTGAGATSTAPGVQTQFTYLDVGMNFDATLDELKNGVRLRTKVEQSSVAEEKANFTVQDPIVRQSVLEGTSFLTPGKPLILGSVDIPGSTRRLDVEVVMEQVP